MLSSDHEVIRLREYKLPSLDDLIVRAKHHVRTPYHKKNETRLQLIKFLELIHEFVEKLKLADKKPSDSDLRDICLGAWIFCFESIANQYRLLNPAFKEGYIYNSGSTLYKILLTQLEINKYHKIGEKNKLDYLNRLYHFIYLSEEIYLVDNNLIINMLQREKISIILKKQLIHTMRAILARENKDEKRILKAIPFEKAIDYNMMKLNQDYLNATKEDNPDRKFLTQLAVAICKLNSPQVYADTIEFEYFISRSERIKIGTLIYIMQSIADTYLIRNPKGNSLLYDLCEKTLVKCYAHLDDSTKLACLTAFENYINDHTSRAKLEKYINKYLLDASTFSYIYIDPKIYPISNNVNKLITKLSVSTKHSPRPTNVTMSVAGIGALIGAAPGYGAGYAIGYTLGLTDQAMNRKEQFSKVTRYVMRVVFDTGTYLGYYVTDTVVNATLERFFAKIFEALGSLVCAAGAGTISFLIFDLSYETARHLCKLYLHLSKNMDPGLLSQADLKFVNTLLALPEEVFSDSKKENLRNITVPSKPSEMSFLARQFTTDLSLSGSESDLDDYNLFHDCSSQKKLEI